MASAAVFSAYAPARTRDYVQGLHVRARRHLHACVHTCVHMCVRASMGACLLVRACVCVCVPWLRVSLRYIVMALYSCGPWPYVVMACAPRLRVSLRYTYSAISAL